MKSSILFTMALFAAFSLNAQNEKKSEIRVSIQKDGKTVKDTVYMVEEGRSVEQASKILDMTFGEPKAGEKHKVMTFISDDGELHEMHSGDPKKGEDHEMMEWIHEGDENTTVFVTTEEGEDGESKVIVKKIKMTKDGDHSFSNEEENVFIMKDGEKGELKHFQHNGEEPVWIEKDGSKVLIIDSKDGMKKKIIVVTDSESDHEFKTEDGNTIIIHTTKAGKNEKEVKVEVIVDDEKAPAVSKKKKEKKTKK